MIDLIDSLYFKMNEFFKKLKPVDVIGFVIVVGGFVLLLNGVDHIVGALLIGVGAYYFGHARTDDKSKTDKSHSGNGGT